ncbi:MAG: type IV pilus modification protein PilV [Thauera sp.]|nr:type IV pilus modification protein PilV [Thauera sp.]
MPLSLESRRLQGGTSLLEVLIAVVILSIGLLGLAGLQVASLRVNQGAMQRSQATILAYDMLDRMRSDVAFVANFRLETPDPNVADNYDAFTTVDGKSVAVSGDVLKGSANRAVSDWAIAVMTAFPAAEAMICRTSNPASQNCMGTGDFIIIQIRWADESNRGVDTQSISVMGQL